MLIRATPLARRARRKVLFYQLAVSAAAAAGRARGARRARRDPPGRRCAVASLAYQAVDRRVRELPDVVLAAHALPRRAARGVLVPDAAVRRRRSATSMLGEPLSPAFVAAAALVGAGIALVNLRRAALRPPRLAVADGEDLVLAHAAGRLHFGDVALVPCRSARGRSAS